MYKGLSILLIENDPVSAARIGKMLRDSPYANARVVLKPSITEGEFFFKGVNTVAVVLFCLDVSSGSGRENLRKLILTYPESSICVLSGSSDPDLIASLFEDGAHNFLNKERLTTRILTQAIRFPMERNHNLLKLQRVYASLKVSEHQFTKLFYDNHLMALTVSTLEGKFLQVNEFFLDILGLTEGEVIGKTARELNIWVDAGKREAYIRRMLNGEKIQNKEVTVRTKNGQTFPILFSMDLIETRQGPMVLTIAQDRTDYLESVRKQGESKKSLDTLINSSSQPMWLVDKNLALLIANQAFYEFMKRSGAEIKIGECILDKPLDEKTRNKWAALYARAMKGERFTVQNQGVNIRSEAFYHNLTLNPAYNDRDELIGIGSFFTDVTDQILANQKLIESEARCHSLVERASDAIFITNDKSEYLDVNEKACKLLGYTREELLRLRGLDIVITDPDVDCLHNRYNKLRAGESLLTFFRMKKKNGSLIHVESNAFMLPEGKFVSIVRDLTERMAAEKAEAEMQRRLKAIFNGTNDAILVAADSGRYLQVNPATEKMLGYPSGKLLQMSYRDLAASETPDDHATFIGGQRSNGTAELRRADGVRIVCQFNAVPSILPGQHLFILTDITEKLKAEAELKSSYLQLQTLTAHLQHVIEEERTRISREVHDQLGQQLTGLKMDASWIVRKMGTENKPVYDKLKEMMALIDDTVKTVRRISTELRPGILDDLGLIAALQWFTNEFEKRTGIVCTFENKVEFNPKRDLASNIFRIYQEALTNVARHAHAKKIETTLEERAGNIYLIIKDDGVGFHLQAARNKKSLGLIGMKERALLFNGDLIVNTKNNAGTTVTLSVPLYQPKPIHEVLDCR